MIILNGAKKVFAILSIWIGIDGFFAYTTKWFASSRSLVPRPFRYRKDYTKKIQRGGVIFQIHPCNSVEWFLYTNASRCGEEATIGHIRKSESNRKIVLFDIGANVGRFSLIVSSVLHAHNVSHEVHAFEPNPEVYRRFEKNVSFNEKLRKHIVLNQIGVSDREHATDMQAPHRNLGAGSLLEDYSGEPSDTYTVPLVSLDAYVRDNHISNVDYLKVDVECYEPYVLSGAAGVIQKHKPTIYIEVSLACIERTNFKEDHIHTLLRQWGYSLFREDETGALIPVHDDVFAVEQYNMLAVHDGDKKDP